MENCSELEKFHLQSTPVPLTCSYQGTRREVVFIYFGDDAVRDEVGQGNGEEKFALGSERTGFLNYAPLLTKTASK